jgi:Zn-dependent protease
MLELLLERAAAFIPVLLSLTVHEWAHAWTAWKLGDDTARMLGRVSLNPIDHIDPVGTLLLPLLGVPFGWAKPVPINPVRFRTNISMPMGVMLTAAAGPISNLVLAALGCAVLAGLSATGNSGLAHTFDPKTYVGLVQIVQMFVLINIVLASFNLLPIPPLDGSRIVDAMIPSSLRPFWSQLSSMGPLLLAAIILLPSLAGVNLFAWPLSWAGELMSWFAPTR